MILTVFIETNWRGVGGVVKIEINEDYYKSLSEKEKENYLDELAKEEFFNYCNYSYELEQENG